MITEKAMLAAVHISIWTAVILLELGILITNCRDLLQIDR